MDHHTTLEFYNGTANSGHIHVNSLFASCSGIVMGYTWKQRVTPFRRIITHDNWWYRKSQSNQMWYSIQTNHQVFSTGHSESHKSYKETIINLLYMYSLQNQFLNQDITQDSIIISSTSPLNNSTNRGYWSSWKYLHKPTNYKIPKKLKN